MTTRVQAGEFCAVKTTREDGTFSRANFTSIVSVILTRHRALRILSAQSAPKHTPSRNTKPNVEIPTRMPAIKYGLVATRKAAEIEKAVPVKVIALRFRIRKLRKYSWQSDISSSAL